MTYSYVYHLNRLAGTLVNNVPQLDEAGAANKWASTKDFATVGALNTLYASRNSGQNQGLDLQGILNAFAGTTGLGCNEAASRITS
jgi:hypothetical protein